MWKKILIVILVIFIGASVFAYAAYKKIEAQFENFMISEMTRKQNEIKQEEAEIEEENETIEVTSTNKEKVSDYLDASNSKVMVVTEIVVESVPEVVVIKTEITNVSQNTTKVETKVETKEETKVETKEETKEEIKEETKEEIKEEVYTKEDFEKDKEAAMSLAMSKLTARQISRLIDISAGGFTSEERQEAKDMFYNNFSTEEQDWILGIYERYYLQASGG